MLKTCDKDLQRLALGAGSRILITIGGNLIKANVSRLKQDDALELSKVDASWNIYKSVFVTFTPR